MGRWWVLALVMAAAVGLSGCADLRCFAYCGSHTHNSSSLVDFLYPHGEIPPQQDAVAQLRIPLRVGLAFLPSNESDATGGLDAAHKEELLERIRQRFAGRPFVTEIVVIPDYYLAGQRRYEGLAGVQRLYGVDVMALVSYDQVTHEDENYWSLGYLTIVGAYVIKGSRHDVSTLVDLAVVDPVTHSLVLRAGGTDTRHGTTTLNDAQRDTRQTSSAGYGAAADLMIEHFDAALTKFESDVRSGKAAVKVVRKNDSGHTGGGGALGWPSILALLMLALLKSTTLSRRVRLERMAK